MTPTLSQHPTDAELTAFARGRLDQSGFEWIGRHLEECAACRERADRTPLAAATPEQATPDELPEIDPAALPPELRDHPRYRVVRALGRGGMGVVYQAEHRVMRRPVAIKVIHPALLDHPTAGERFDREVRAAARIDHPNIVKAYDAEQAGDLRLLAMEYVEGSNLADVVARTGPLPVGEACQYARQVALGLQHAHERGMVHRDLKPSNLMLTPDGTVKILDFGLAKVLSERQSDGLTQDNVMMGTPEYMAPEQARDTRGADIRADVYALGCTLYGLLTGRPPFKARGSDYLSVVMAHLEQTPRPVTDFRPDVPPAIVALLDRMLAKAPADRPQVPLEVAEALAPFAQLVASAAKTAGLATPTFPSIQRSAGRKSTSGGVSRRKGIVAIAAGLAVPLAIGLWATGVFRSKPADGTIILTVADPGSDVLIDGTRAATVGDEEEPIEIRRPSGTYVVEIRKPGFTTQKREVTITPGGRTELTVDLELSTEARPPGGSSPDALFKNGSIWSGRQAVHIPNQKDPSAKVTLTVMERSGDTFRALYQIANSELRIKGTVKAGTIFWHADDVQVESPKPKGNPPNIWDYSGRINGDRILLKYQVVRTSKPKGRFAGDATLKLVKP
ncbi:MAG TPA: protein kinase [Gemmataceae bacterium]|nr:protein kinase [Gemmataceae bacterium]